MYISLNFRLYADQFKYAVAPRRRARATQQQQKRRQSAVENSGGIMRPITPSGFAWHIYSSTCSVSHDYIDCGWHNCQGNYCPSVPSHRSYYIYITGNSCACPYRQYELVVQYVLLDILPYPRNTKLSNSSQSKIRMNDILRQINFNNFNMCYNSCTRRVYAGKRIHCGS